MKDHGSGHVSNGLDGPFCHIILVIGIRAAKPKKLLWLMNMGHKGVHFERNIASQVLLYNYSLIHAMAFKILIGVNCFHRVEPNLMITLDVSWGTLNKQSASHILCGWGLPIEIASTTLEPAFEVIHRIFTPDLDITDLESAISLGNLGMRDQFLGTALLLRELARVASWMFTSNSIHKLFCNEMSMSEVLLHLSELEAGDTIMPCTQ
jgi:hypothetical protein